MALIHRPRIAFDHAIGDEAPDVEFDIAVEVAMAHGIIVSPMQTAESVDIGILGNVIPSQYGGCLQALFRATCATGQKAFQCLCNPKVLFFVEIGIEFPSQFGIVAETVHDFVQQGNIVFSPASTFIALGKENQFVPAGVLIPEFLTQLDGFTIICLGVLRVCTFSNALIDVA